MYHTTMLKQPSVAGVLRRSKLMEGQSATSASLQQNDYLPYKHTDACCMYRWTAKESFQFMYARRWQTVKDFYLDSVNGVRSLSELFGKEACAAVPDGAENAANHDKSDFVIGINGDMTGKWARVTFKIILAYHGVSFDGWQKQPGLNTVQGLVESSLGKFVDEKKIQMLKDKKLPIDVCAVVAGRTDKGVTALNQVCSFYTWRNDVEMQEIVDVINGVIPGKIRAISVSRVSRTFHPNFSAKWRHYFYIFPLNDEDEDDENGKFDSNIFHQHCNYNQFIGEKNGGDVTDEEDRNSQVTGKKPSSFEVSRVNILLNQLEGKQLSYKMFARDTKASRNIGPATECFVFHARATEAKLPSSKDGIRKKTMCVELVANRFLRKMVRVLVATAIREAAAGAEENVLLKLMDATCRRATAPPAPSEGLCLVGVGYKDFDRKNCFII